MRIFRGPRMADVSNRVLNPKAQAALNEGSLPPLSLMELVAGTIDANWFIDSGRFGFETIKEAIERQGISLDRFSAVLDFGCGSGRVIRHWCSQTHLKLAGCDYNPRLIDWCQNHLPFAKFQVNSLGPPLSYVTGQFDLVYAFSVFTHLNLPRQRDCLEELARILRPGGFLIVSTHGDAYLGELAAEQRARYLAGEVVVVMPKQEGSNDCSAFHPPQAFRFLVKDHFTVLEFVPQ
jgi:SAM-dependent methyltransferase